MWTTVLISAIVAYMISSALRIKDYYENKRSKKVEIPEILKWHQTKPVLVEVGEHTDAKLMNIFYAVIPDLDRSKISIEGGKVICKCYFYGDERNN